MTGSGSLLLVQVDIAVFPDQLDEVAPRMARPRVGTRFVNTSPNDDAW